MSDAPLPFAPDTVDPAAIADAELRDTAGGPYGLTPQGYVAKPYARLVSEGLARAQRFFGEDVDLRTGSVIRRLVEMQALTHASLHAQLAETYDQLFVSSATGDALSRLGEELGLPRPQERAEGQIRLQMAAPPPDGAFVVPAGSRLLTAGGHHVALVESARFEAARPSVTVRVQAFYPGPDHNLDPAAPDQAISRWHPADPKLDPLRNLAEAADEAPEDTISITHDTTLRGGERLWGDAPYRSLVLHAPRSLWTVEALRTAILLVPGVEEVQVVDEFGGLDLERSIFGNFNFIQRLFSGQRDLGSPYAFGVIVKAAPAAIWTGAEGLRATIAETIEDIRPIGVFPDIRQAEEVSLGIAADLVVEGAVLPSGDRDTVNASAAARELKARLLERVRTYVRSLSFGETVRASQVSWAMLNEPALRDVQELRLVRALPSATELGFGAPLIADVVTRAATLDVGENLTLAKDQVAVFRDDPSGLRIL